MTDEIKTIYTNCDACDVEIRAIVPITQESKYHWCNKIKCKLLVTMKNNLDWRRYIIPSKWEEAIEIIKEIEGKEFK